MTPAQILALIASTIVTNGVGGITAANLAPILDAIVNLFTTTSPAARLVSASTTLTIAVADFRIGFQRTVNLAAFNAQLPSGASIGQEFVLQDLVGNLSQYPVTVLPPAGMSIVGRASYVMNEDNQTSRFAYYGANIWGVEPA
jgi:hypothetical protein